MEGSRRDNTNQILPVLPPSLDYPREITPPATLPANKRAALNLAIIGVLADGGLRHSEAAVLGDGFSGHSGHIGMARRMLAAGAPNAAVQRQGRWKNGNMVARYTRGESAGEALKWLT